MKKILVASIVTTTNDYPRIRSFDLTGEYRAANEELARALDLTIEHDAISDIDGGVRVPLEAMANIAKVKVAGLNVRGCANFQRALNLADDGRSRVQVFLDYRVEI